MSRGGKQVPGPGKRIGRPSKPGLTAEEFEAMVQEQGGLCALCSEPGSVGGLVVDIDGLRNSVRGMLHPNCKAFLVLGRDNPRRFQRAIAYLEQRAAAPPRLIVRPPPPGVPKSPENPAAQVVASTAPAMAVPDVP
jgi:Recombination endonuclease VII